jgi:hypothetical protein
LHCDRQKNTVDPSLQSGVKPPQTKAASRRRSPKRLHAAAVQS